MPINFSEAVLGQLFREKNEDGTYRGGPAYYIQKGLNNKVLATLFSISLVIGIGFIYVMIQSNSITAALTGVVDFPPVLAGAILVVLVGTVIFGGIRRLSEISSYIVPFMAAAYIGLALFVVIINIRLVPQLLSTIFSEAFSFKAAAGGVAGYTIKEAFRFGIARGLFSNDAGNGTTPSMHASASVKHPVNQGLTAMLGVFTTTIIICSCTAFCILLSGALDSGQTGIQLTQLAFANSFGGFGKWIVLFAMFLFGYTTLLADIYYGEVNIRFILPNLKNSELYYRILSCGLILAGSILPVESLWEMADFCSAFMVFFNVIALFGLSKYVNFALKDYQFQKARRMETPLWNYDLDITVSEFKKSGGSSACSGGIDF